MSTKYSLFKGRLYNVLVLASLVICLGADSCSQCKNVPNDESLPKNDEPLIKKVIVQIVPLSSLSLGGGDKAIQCKLQQAKNSAAVDLAKLRLKITAVPTPAAQVSQIHYNNASVSELAGKQMELNQEITLTLVTTDATEKVDITLQIVYEDKPLEGPSSSQTFMWEKIGVTEKLFQAICDNNKEEAIALLNKGNIRAGARNLSGETLLREAIANHNDPTVIEKLISVPDMDLNAVSALPKDLPLELAIAENQLEIFKLLFKKGAQTKPGTTILDVAIEKNKIPMIKYILDNYDNLKDSKGKDGNTPLHRAVIEQYPKLVNLLLNKGADRSIKNNAGKTPMDLAQEKIATAPNVMGAFNGTYTDSL